MSDFLAFFSGKQDERVRELHCQTQSSTLVQIVSPNAFFSESKVSLCSTVKPYCSRKPYQRKERGSIKNFIPTSSE